MEINRRDLVKGALAIAVTGAVAEPARGYLEPVESHLETIIKYGTDVYGPVKTPMWMASLDTATYRYPDRPFAAIGQRAYREIGAPHGSSMYWDQPELVAAYAISDITGNPLFKNAVDAYVRSFLERCIDEYGLFQWGNHRYYDAFTDQVVQFHQGFHEIRALTPAWEVFWRIDPKATEREIRVAAKRHIYDPVVGAFNRHDDGKKGDAFLMAGGPLLESLCWLAKKTGDRSLVDLALRVAHFSFAFRDSRTGLVENQPTEIRWDSYVSTTELGLWAGCLLRSADATGVADFAQMADQAMTPYLRYGYDDQAKEYYGQIQVKDGKPPVYKPETGDLSGNYRYKADGTKQGGEDRPLRYANIWNALFPSHDYPMVFADTCVELYRRTKGPQYREAIDRWVDVVKRHPAPTTAFEGIGAYAENFGFAIQFLTNAGLTLNSQEYMAEARKLADASINILFTHGMFRTHASEDRYDAVDDPGALLLALIYLQTGKQPDPMGYGT